MQRTLSCPFLRSGGEPDMTGGPARAERDSGIHLNHVTPGYFDTLGIRLLAGRLFAPRDQSNSLKVAILNDTAARFYFGEVSPIGRKVSFPGQVVTDEYEVVGVTRDTRYENLRSEAERMVYLPIGQPIDRITGVMLSIRGSVDARSLVPAIRNEVRLAVPDGVQRGEVYALVEVRPRIQAARVQYARQGEERRERERLRRQPAPSHVHYPAETVTGRLTRKTSPSRASSR